MGGRIGSRAPRKPWLRRLILPGVLVLSGPAAAGPWPRDKGEGMLILTTLMDRADGFFDTGRERQSGGYFYKDEISAYIEYGATDRFTLVGRFAWQNVDQFSEGVRDTAQGFAASELGIRGQFLQSGPWRVSAQFSYFFPGEGENVTNQPLGQGDEARDMRLLVGRALPRNGFSDLQVGYRSRDGRFLDEWRVDATIGMDVAERWSVMAQTYSVWNA